MPVGITDHSVKMSGPMDSVSQADVTTDDSFDNYIESPLIRWALQLVNKESVDNEENKKVVGSCALLLDIFQELKHNKIDDVAREDTVDSRYHNLRSWLKCLHDFTNQELDMIVVCPMPDIDNIVFDWLSGVGLMNYEACLLIMLACFITYLPASDEPGMMNLTEDDMSMLSNLNVSSILLSRQRLCEHPEMARRSMDLLSRDRLVMSDRLLSLQCTRQQQQQLVSSDDGNSAAGVCGQTKKHIMATSGGLTTADLTTMIEELELEMDNREVEMRKTNALLVEKSNEINRLGSKLKTMEDELVFKRNYIDEVDKLVEEAAKVKQMEQKLQSMKKQLEDKQDVEKTIQTLTMENRKLSDELDELRQSENIMRDSDRIQMEAEMKLLKERLEMLSRDYSDKTTRLMELHRELEDFKKLNLNRLSFTFQQNKTPALGPEFEVDEKVDGHSSWMNGSPTVCLLENDTICPSEINSSNAHVAYSQFFYNDVIHRESRAYQICRDSCTQTDARYLPQTLLWQPDQSSQSLLPPLAKSFTTGTATKVSASSDQTFHAQPIPPPSNIEFRPTFSVTIRQDHCSHCVSRISRDEERRMTSSLDRCNDGDRNDRMSPGMFMFQGMKTRQEHSSKDREFDCKETTTLSNRTFDRLRCILPQKHVYNFHQRDHKQSKPFDQLSRLHSEGNELKVPFGKRSVELRDESNHCENYLYQCRLEEYERKRFWNAKRDYCVPAKYKGEARGEAEGLFRPESSSWYYPINFPATGRDQTMVDVSKSIPMLASLTGRCLPTSTQSKKGQRDKSNGSVGGRLFEEWSHYGCV